MKRLSFIAAGFLGVVLGGCAPDKRDIRMEMWRDRVGWSEVLLRGPKGVYEEERYEQILGDYRASALRGMIIDDNFMSNEENERIRKLYGWIDKEVESRKY